MYSTYDRDVQIVKYLKDQHTVADIAREFNISVNKANGLIQRFHRRLGDKLITIKPDMSFKYCIPEGTILPEPQQPVRSSRGEYTRHTVISLKAFIKKLPNKVNVEDLKAAAAKANISLNTVELKDAVRASGREII